MERFLKWCLQESNQGHKDFQSFALPTELRHQLLPIAIGIADANINPILKLTKRNFIKIGFVNLPL